MPETLATLVGITIDRIHTAYHADNDQLTLIFSDRRRLEVPVDLVVPVGQHEWDDYWTDFEDFLDQGPDDLEPEQIEGEVMTLAELLEKRVVGVRTGQGSAGGRYCVLDLDGSLGLLLPAAKARLSSTRLCDCSDFADLLDPEVSRQVQEEPDA